MAAKLGISLQNRLRPKDSVAVHPATVEIVRPNGNLSAQANKWGEVSLDMAGLADGTYTMHVTPGHTSAGKVDSTLAEEANPPDRMYRSLKFDITVAKQAVTGVSQANTTDGLATLNGPLKLTVSLQPIWMKSPSYGRGTSVLSLIVIHHTGGPTIGPAMNTAMDGVGPHYEIDTDGQIVKYVQESRSAGHAGASQWNGEAVQGKKYKSLNAISIGIEIVHESGPFQEPQYTSLLELLEAILKANPGIRRNRIVGHSDIATDDSGVELSNRRADDPGEMFEWTRLEDKKLGMIPKAITVVLSDFYFGFFQLFPSECLCFGDDDAKNIYGGRSLAQRLQGEPQAARREGPQPAQPR